MASFYLLPCFVLVAVLVLFSVNAAEAAIREYLFDVSGSGAALDLILLVQSDS
jgi:hypothetical protein